MQDIRKKNSGLKSNSISREGLHVNRGSSISHRELTDFEERRPRFVHSDDISLYRERPNQVITNTKADDEVDFRKASDHKKTWRKIKNVTSYILFLFVLFAVYYSLTFVFDRAKVTITPNYKDVEVLNLPIQVGEKGSFAFQTVNTEAVRTKSLPKTTTTIVDKKATGEITIYNNYSTAPQRLVKFTRFETKEKKIYKIIDSVTIPGKTTDAPGQIKAKVVAESEGPEYNIDATEFTIPGFKGKEQYTTIYAKTFSAIVGGSSGSKAIVALTDLNAAKDEIAQNLRENLKKDFAAKTYENKVPLIESISVKIEDNSENILRGESDIYSAKGFGTMALIEESQLSKFILASEGDVERSLEYRFSPSSNFSLSIKKDTPLLASSTLSLSATGKARIIFSTDYKKLQDNLVGKTRKDFSTVISGDKTISSATVSIFPPWKGGLPAHKDGITIKEKLAEFKK